MDCKSGYPFGEVRYFIITPSAATGEAIHRMLQEKWFSGGHIFTDPTPATNLTHRHSEQTLRSRYCTCAPSFLRPARHYTSLVYEPRAWKGNSEAYSAGDLNYLVAAVCNTHTSQTNFTTRGCTLPPPETRYIAELIHDYAWNGPYCRSIDMDCLADQQESAIYLSSPVSLGDEQVLAVIGTPATETENATY